MTSHKELENDLSVHFNGLVSVLKTEIQVYEEMLKLVLGEKQVLLSPSLHKIQENNAKKETLLLKSKMLETVRANTIRKIADSLNLDEQSLNLSTLATYADRKCGKELEECRTVLHHLLQQIGSLNATNRVLLETSLSCVRGSINFINHLMYAGPTYVETGSISRQRGNGKVICTEG
jgi:hypothetical protein